LKIAFYAPLKSPDHPRPSGDRRLARYFMEALRMAGCQTELASELRAWEGEGDARRQAEIKARGQRDAERLIAEYRQRRPAERPRCWFTYHLYHKAPDWLGPAVSAALGIPYVAAEASVANKQGRGAWRDGYLASVAAIARARLIFNLNSNDLAGLQPHVGDAARIVPLKPFADIPPPAAADKMRLRRGLAGRRGIDPGGRWLLCVAMMRAGSKRDSYRILADALARLKRDDWQLLVAGDGAAAQSVRDEFQRRVPGRAHFLGRLDSAGVHDAMRAADLLVWPACNEAFGMAVLEALGCGLPVVAGRSGGIGDIIEHAVTGMLIDQVDGASMAAAIDKLLAAPATLARMSAASTVKFNRFHRLDRAAAELRSALFSLVG